MSKKLREGDRVVVIAGNYKGQTGKILSKVKDRFVVEGVNIRKKHVKARSQEQPGGILELEMPVHASNVMLAGEGDRPVKLHTRINASGEKEHYYRQDGKEKVHRTVSRSAVK